VAKPAGGAERQTHQGRALPDRQHGCICEVAQMTKNDAHQAEIDNNLEFFLKELPKIAAQRGKLALIRHQKIINFFDTPLDALSAGTTLYPDKIFSIQQVTDIATNLGYYSYAVSMGDTQ
jgi:hypothetical protein